MIGILLAGQGVATAATPIAVGRISPQDTSGSDKAAVVSGEDDGEPTGDEGESTGEGDEPTGEGDEPTGDDGEPTGDVHNAGPPPARAQSPTVQTLTRGVATSRAKSVLSRRFGRVYTHGNHKRLSCRRRSASSYFCSLSWRYHQQRYNGHAIVSRTGLVKTHVVSRRAA